MLAADVRFYYCFNTFLYAVSSPRSLEQLVL